MSNISDSLIEAYHQTTYAVPELDINIRIGEQNENLNKLLRSEGAQSWVFITAWNPYSEEQLSPEENQQRNQRLEAELQDYTYWPGEGIPDNTDWAPEASFLVLEVSEETIRRWMRTYKQNAVVCGESEQPAELLYNDHVQPGAV